MIKIKFKTLGVKQIPESWEEITVLQWLEMKYNWNQEDPLQLMAIMTGFSYQELFASGEDLAAMETVLKGVIKDQPLAKDLQKQVPKTYTLQDKVLKIIPVANATLGQKLYFQSLGSGIETKEDLPRLLAAVCAIYLAPQWFDKDVFSVEDAEILTAIILQEPYKKLAPLSFFFSKACRISILAGINGSKKVQRDNLRKAGQPGRVVDLLYSPK